MPGAPLELGLGDLDAAAAEGGGRSGGRWHWFFRVGGVPVGFFGDGFGAVVDFCAGFFRVVGRWGGRGCGAALRCGEGLVVGKQAAARGDVALESVVEQERRREEVAAVEAGDGEGDDVVEGGVGADVDELQEHGEQADDEDGDDGDLRSPVDFFQEPAEGEGLVAREGPGHARGGGGDADGAAPGQDQDDGAHGRGAFEALDAVCCFDVGD